MKLGSLFDGSGTAPLCAAILGWEPVWASEIEPFPIKVTSKRFPRMKHLGDITKIRGGEIEPVDVIVGGSPCQDLSVAGKQAGLQGGTRSHLFYEMTRIIKEMRVATNGKYPRYIVWENVPGAFSSNQGRDFHEVLKAFVSCADHPCDVPEPARGGADVPVQTSLFGEMPAASWETVSPSAGECWMRNTGECPSVAVESFLRSILVENAPEKYFLSAKACGGILNRAERRGKALPPLLWEALIEVLEMEN